MGSHRVTEFVDEERKLLFYPPESVFIGVNLWATFLYRVV